MSPKPARAPLIPASMDEPDGTLPVSAEAPGCDTCFGFGALESEKTLANGTRVFVATPCPDCLPLQAAEQV